MSSRSSDARQRVVSIAAEMLSQHGLNASSVREMAKRADAPFGSTYHYFPGGKQQLVAEAVAMAGVRMQARLQRCLQAGVEPGIGQFLAMWRELLLRSDFHQGCPVMAAVVDQPLDGIAAKTLDAAAQAFGGWEAALSSALRADGHTEAAAAQLATLTVASVEGAIALCRAQRSIAPLERVAEQLKALLRAPG